MTLEIGDSAYCRRCNEPCTVVGLRMEPSCACPYVWEEKVSDCCEQDIMSEYEWEEINNGEPTGNTF